MPHSRSAKKNVRKSEKRRLKNKAVLRELRLQMKVVEDKAGGSLEELRTECALAAKKLDKAGARRVIHPNKASRLKSHVGKLLAKKEKGQ
ncbi:MAG: 30S ribosomal protein S20 [Gemmataceae bacterium]|nr:30S ribosomal protein S20 [Gemmataceae bacterium]